MVILNFLTEKVRKYQEKKLNDAIQKIQFHKKIKKRLETDLKINNESNNIKNEIIKQNESIVIWEKNIIKIKEQIEKLQK